MSVLPAWRKEVGISAAEGLALVGRERSDVNQSRDFRIVAGLGDDRATVGMTNQQHRGVLRFDHAIGRGHIIGNRAERILDGYDMQPFGLQKRDKLGPTGAIGPSAVDEYYVFYTWH